ncbi:type IV fimbrial biogenesis protein FimT [Neisseria sp. HSC-16F19]|nr:GspH/FimT family pseudopilin [Neisseria sp. HSC-16F19]MCP2040299.1 type IV fimbrial biogenesis protein FimT [Neisseria sp. HSC-16F19]
MITKHYTSKQRGFTLIELMVTITIVAIMAAIALPNMSSWVNKRRVANRAEQTANLFRFARSEAVRLNLPVVVCYTTIRTDGKANVPCNAAAETEQKGFTAFASKKGGLPYDSNIDEVLRTVAVNQNGSANKVNITTHHLGFDEAIKTGTTGNIWIFYPNGTFGYTNQNTGSVRGSHVHTGSGLVRLDFNDATTTNTAALTYRRSKIILDASGRISTCMPTDSRSACTAS